MNDYILRQRPFAVEKQFFFISLFFFVLFSFQIAVPTENQANDDKSIIDDEKKAEDSPMDFAANIEKVKEVQFLFCSSLCHLVAKL